MYDELTEVDIRKMQEEIDYRVRVLRPKLIEDVQREPHPLPGADDPHGKGDLCRIRRGGGRPL